MKKAFIAVLCGFLALWLLIACGEAGERESASIPPVQSAGGESDGPGADTGTLPPQEAVPGGPAFSEVVSSTPVPTEEAPATSAPVENPPEIPISSETITSEPTPGVDYPFTLIYQNPELPNGCEITSLAMLLDWAGYPVDKRELSDNYLPRQEFSIVDDVRYGPDPNEAYAGSPASSQGWYCFEGPILEAANAYLADQNTTQQAAPLSGTTREELENYMNAGIPLAVWVTLDYSAPRNPASFRWYLPDGTLYTPFSNLHCVVLAGWDGDNYLIANPINGWQTVSPGTFWSCFDAMGRRAVAVLP